MPNLAEYLGVQVNTDGEPNSLSREYDYMCLRGLNILDKLNEIFGLKLSLSAFSIETGEVLDEAWKGVTLVEDNLSLTFDKELIQSVLIEGFGPSEQIDSFSCNKMTDLEKDLISETMLETISTIQTTLNISINEGAAISTQSSEARAIHLIWRLPQGKLMLSLPQEAIEAYKLNSNLPVAPIESEQIMLKTKLYLGATKMNLSNIKSIALGDLLLLTDSNKGSAQILGINTTDKQLIIKTIPDQLRSFKIDLPETDLNSNMNHELDNLGDFELEVNAEFRDINMRLSEVQKLQSGQAIDLGELKESKIYLTSQGKTLAKGELTVVNNKYAVIIEELIMSSESPDTEIKATVQTPQGPAPVIPVEPQPLIHNEPNEDAFDQPDHNPAGLAENAPAGPEPAQPATPQPPQEEKPEFDF